MQQQPPASKRSAGRGRGEGMVYTGTVAEAHGAIVLAMDDCDCTDCIDIDPWLPARRVNVRLVDGRRLTHARVDSFGWT